MVFYCPNVPNILGSNFSIRSSIPGRLISESRIWWEFFLRLPLYLWVTIAWSNACVFRILHCSHIHIIFCRAMITTIRTSTWRIRYACYCSWMLLSYLQETEETARQHFFMPRRITKTTAHHVVVLYFHAFSYFSDYQLASHSIGSLPKNEYIISRSVWGAASSGEGPRCIRQLDKLFWIFRSDWIIAPPHAGHVMMFTCSCLIKRCILYHWYDIIPPARGGGGGGDAIIQLLIYPKMAYRMNLGPLPFDTAAQTLRDMKVSFLGEFLLVIPRTTLLDMQIPTHIFSPKLRRALIRSSAHERNRKWSTAYRNPLLPLTSLLTRTLSTSQLPWTSSWRDVNCDRNVLPCLLDVARETKDKRFVWSRKLQGRNKRINTTYIKVEKCWGTVVFHSTLTYLRRELNINSKSYSIRWFLTRFNLYTITWKELHRKAQSCL